ncbi:MAG: GNAT family N-acetyltransferase [Sphaerospermopsis kisseleviana]
METFLEVFCTDDQLRIRRMMDSEFDYANLSKWLSDPQILEFYGDRSSRVDLESISTKYRPRTEKNSDVIACILELECSPIGYCQFYSISEGYFLPMENNRLFEIEHAFGIDIFIGDREKWGIGLGTKSIGILVEYLFKTRNATCVYIDPATTNERAIRCYSKVGFQKKIEIQNRETNGDRLVDSLIMSLTRAQWVDKVHFLENR